MRMNFLWAPLLTGLVAFALNCAPKPTEKEMEGKIKGKASLRLADGSTISQDGSDEYNPYLVQLSDGYLVLVFASDRNGGLHNIFVAKSVEPYNGFELPFFNTPVAVTATASPIDDANMISFAATAQGTSINLYVNLHTASGFIRKGVVTDPLAPDVGSFAAITNANQESNTIIGINADGADLVTTDAGGIAYLVNPDNNTASSAFGANLDYSESATQVRFDNSGQNDAYMGTYFGSTFAATATDYFGPIFDFDLSLAESGLSIGQMTTFYDSNGAYGDMTLFAAHDGISADIYVVTSHTSGMLWNMVAFFGFDTFLPPAPLADHWYEFESFSCPPGTAPTDSILGAPWDATTCVTGVTQTASSYNGSNYADFSGSPYVNLGSRDLGASFTITAWVNINAGSCSGTMCTIAANAGSSPMTATGFRFFYNGPTGTLRFVTGDVTNLSSQTAESIVINDGLPFNIVDGFWHHVAVTVTPANGMAWLYLDGALVSSTFMTETTFSTNTANLWLGMMTNSQNAFFGGMDDVKIYSYELDPMSVLALYLE